MLDLIFDTSFSNFLSSILDFLEAFKSLFYIFLLYN